MNGSDQALPDAGRRHTEGLLACCMTYVSAGNDRNEDVDIDSWLNEGGALGRDD